MVLRLLYSIPLLVLAVAVLSPVAFAQIDPVALFRQAVDIRNRGDVDGLMALFSDDAVRQDGSCPRTCVGTAALRQSFEENVAVHFQATVLSAQATGDTVKASAELRSDRFRALGAERIISDFTVETRAGKIVRWASTLDTSDAQTAAYQAAVQAQAGQTPTPAPAPGVSPTFKLGLAVLASLITEIVGQPLEDEHYSANGDSLQRTLNGLLVWRKADNRTAFTDGYKTWMNGPNGLESRLNSERFDWEK